MDIKPAAAVASLALALTLGACGGGAPASTPAPTSEAQPAQGEGADSAEGAPQGVGTEGAPGMDYPVEAGGTYTYPDGLEVQVGNWRLKGEASADGSDPKPTVYLDVTATNPTDEPLTTTQVWVSVRAGETGEELQGWAEGESVDAVLQPGASVTGEYVFTAPETPGHVVATVLWHESDDPMMRYETLFAVED